VAGTDRFLGISFLTKILRSSGGFFIDREKLKDPLYQSIVQEYVQMLLNKKITIEHFIEMERSRSGKVRRSKSQIIRYVFQAYFKNPS
jgi:glycerol-3-phosphate O-acyltransferase